MKKKYILISFFLIVGIRLIAQVGIKTDNSLPDISAMLDVQSATKGVLLPRMTRLQRNLISVPAEGLMVYCTNCGTHGSLSVFTNGSWLTFSPCIIASPAAGMHVMSEGQIIWNWLAVPGISGYKWNTTSDYETATDMNVSLSKTETGTGCGTTYSRYVWAYSICGESVVTELTSTIPATVTDTPAEGIHLPGITSVEWNWNTTAGATGYKWNSENDYGTAVDLGPSNTSSETGLTCGTTYTRYAWAYNGCGNSTPVTLTQSTLNCWTCGDPITISHVTGAVAPVDKTVNYGTVTNIPGELAKCWITRNLGAAQQATVVSDATEASAGWYFQFNRKQGYKHDGAIRTPNSTWISNISENSDWITANDPCNLELGNAWRIPTYTEWYNVDDTGVWFSWAGPWDSGLKLHCAGFLTPTDGSLYSRGSQGNYWSSTQTADNSGWHLVFTNTFSGMNGVNKAVGFSARCVRDF
ncbi:MAG: hypothetical protein NT040_10875 [Bacteroidetes bacterium]|nr:hypothetical protein [Bacteroidota bacterium]